MKDEQRSVHLIGALGAVRTETYEGRPHLVVPVVALMDGVIHAVNSDVPERVRTAVLARAAHTANGRPAVLGHPVKNGEQCSANEPQVLSARGFGAMFNARMFGTKLLMDAYVDPVKAEAVGGPKFLERLKDPSRPIEVSVGVFTRTSDTTGVHDGKKFLAQWEEIQFDHLAFLPDGRGACSVEMGCGAHRAAAMRVLEDSFELETLDNPEGVNQYSHGGGASHKIGDKVQIHTPNAKDKSIAKSLHGRTGTVTNVKSDADGNRHVEVKIDESSKHYAAGQEYTFRPHELKGLEMKSIIDPETLRCLRDIPQSERDQMKSSDFAGPNESFPIKTQADVDAAKTLIGKADNPDAVKKKIISIAKRKGLKVPAAWQSKAAQSFADLRRRMLALFDTPEQAASEEAAELVSYKTMRTLMDAVGAQYDEASALVDDLIADEEENPTETRQQEEAEEEVEDARMTSLRMLCYSMQSALGNIVSACYDQQAPDLPEPTDARYMEAFRTAIGKSISAKNMKVIQAAHDASHDTHTSTVALGADCKGMKLLAGKTTDCPDCGGTGQKKNAEGAQADCPTCDGNGTLKAAAAAEEKQMKPEIKEKILKALSACGCEEAKLKAMSDDQLQEAMLEANIKNATDLKTLQTKQTETEAALKTAQAAQLTPEQMVQFKALTDEREAAEKAEKDELVVKLLAASKAKTKEQLDAMGIGELRTLAAYAKVETPVDVTFVGRGMPVLRGAQESDLKEYAAPDPYAPGLKALQEQGSKAVN